MTAWGELDLGVEQVGEARVVGHVLEVGVGAGLDAVAWIVADGLGEVLEALVAVSGEAGEDGEAVEGVVGGGMLLQDELEVLACVFVVAQVEQGDGVVVLFFVAGEAGFAFRDLEQAGVDVHADAVGEVSGGAGEHLVEGGVGFVVLALLHELQSGLIAGDGLGAAGVKLRGYDAGQCFWRALLGDCGDCFCLSHIKPTSFWRRVGSRWHGGLLENLLGLYALREVRSMAQTGERRSKPYRAAVLRWE